MSLFPIKNTKILLLLLILILGFSMRFFPYFSKIKEYPVPLTTTDPFYHARRIMSTVHNYPHLLTYDYYLSYPTGAYCIWPPLFDFLAATIIWFGTLGGKISSNQMVWLIAVYPILYGLLVIWLTFLIAKKIFTIEVAYLSAIFAAILPGLIIWSNLGYCDHHIAESMSLIGILYLLIYKQSDKISDFVRLGIFFGISLLLWQGSILFIGVAFLVLFLRAAHKSFITFFITGLMIFPFILNTNYPDGPFSYRGLSFLHLSLLTIAMLIMLTLYLYKKYSFLISSVTLFILGILVILLFKEKTFIGGFGFIFKNNPWLSSIMEFQPLMIRDEYISTLSVNSLYGRAYYVWPFMMVLFLLKKRDRIRNTFALFSIFTCIMSFNGYRYTVWFAPLYVILLSATLFQIYYLLRKLIPRCSRILSSVVVTILIIVIFQPVYKTFFSKVPPGISKEEEIAYKWLANSTPSTSYYLTPNKKPEYGIMCFWNYGHKLLFLAKRPVSASNFGDDVPNFQLVNKFFLLEDEKEVYHIMDSLNYRYIFYEKGPQILYWIVKYLGLNENNYYQDYYYKTQSSIALRIFDIKKKGLLTLIMRLRFDGLPVSIGKTYYHPYNKLRLVFCSNIGDIKIFEYVKGAVIAIKTSPNSSVGINKYVQVGSQKFIYSDSLYTDEGGKIHISVPYSADTSAPYNIITIKGIKKIQVPESAVVNGDTIQISL